MWYLWRNFLDVHILADDGWVVSSTRFPMLAAGQDDLSAGWVSQLESHSLQGLCGTSHDFLAGKRRPGEGDLVNVFMLGEPWPEIVIAA